ncbi:VCBS repeat-containing protein [Pelagicoccus sp. NFK12]|uniref:VCBS repeat-containing protein n=1 Tax=Pelagicoccus enzymogenes TaxID=2773457 RepID=A0A927F6N9_9BACT|nr:VCBS repeat-containing protein [Pelagicoccus enzymogenes]MBD5779447.1 VCBS repeat-containing protein [Pelagicoccus enzymogenes]
MSKHSRAKYTALALCLSLAASIAIVFWPNPQATSIQSSYTKNDSSKLDFDFLARRSIGKTSESVPWITHIAAHDLDRDGYLDLLACDAQENRIQFLRQTKEGEWIEQSLGSEIEGPVHVDFADIDGDGDTDILVAAMGMVLPNRERIGSVVVLENRGNLNFRNREILSNTDRVTDVRAADFDKDGDLDLAIGQFGYDRGAIRWLEQSSPWNFKSHDILLKSGTINVETSDIDNDGDSDIIALVSQEWEEVYCFFNDGTGEFRPEILWGSTNQDYGSSGLKLADLDRDGDQDILYTNGDGFDYSNPGPRPWHGVQWLENRGNGFFVRKPVGLMAGAFSPIASDIDQDGDLDILASSACNEWGSKDAFSLVCFENDGQLHFTKRPLALSPTHIVSIIAEDLDGDGVQEIVSAGFHAYPPWDDTSRISIWSPQ